MLQDFNTGPFQQSPDLVSNPALGRTEQTARFFSEFAGALAGLDFEAAQIGQARRIAVAHYLGMSVSVDDITGARPAGAALRVEVDGIFSLISLAAKRTPA